MSKIFLEKVFQFILEKNIPLPPSRLLVGLSGGADSVALLIAMQKLGYDVEAAHCNFHLRGDESIRDEQFSQELCKQRGIPFHVIHFDTLEYAASQRLSIEMAARELRYQWFRELIKETDSLGICVAHHMDDNAETLLLNLLRGSGLHGLTGIKANRDQIFRPLLNVSRRDIEQFLKDCQQDFVVDSTNQENHYRRNYLRNKVIPMLETINPAVVETLHQTAQRLMDTEKLNKYALEQIKQEMVKKGENGIEIDLSQLRNIPGNKSLLFDLLQPYGFTSVTIPFFFPLEKHQSGTIFEAQDYQAVFHRNQLIVCRKVKEIPATPLPYTGEILLPYGGKLMLSALKREELASIPLTPDTACADADKLVGELCFRSIRKGDRFTPFGMKGSRLVSDFLTDRHCSLVEKQRQLAVCDEKGIIWLVGRRPDARIAIDSTTKRVLMIHKQE